MSRLFRSAELSNNWILKQNLDYFLEGIVDTKVEQDNVRFLGSINIEFILVWERVWTIWSVFEKGLILNVVKPSNGGTDYSGG